MGKELALPDPRRKGTLVAALCSLGALGLYLLTIAPTVQGFDSAELTVGAYDLGFVHPPGYPLYLSLGHLFVKLPLGDVGYNLNLMSAIFASLTAFVLFKILFRQTRSLWASSIATVLLVTSPPFWSQAIRAEVYTLHLFLMTAALYAWFHALETQRDYGYLLCFFLLGLGAGNHPTTALLWLSTLICTIWLPAGTRRSVILGNLLVILTASAVYLYFPLRSGANLQIDYIRPYFGIDPGSPGGLWWMISGQAFQCLLLPLGHTTQLWYEVTRLVNFLWEGTLGFGLILGFWGWLSLKRNHPLWNRLLTIYFITNLVMFLGYGAIDKEVMFLPLLVVISIWAATGFKDMTAWVASVRQGHSPEAISTLTGTLLVLIMLMGLALDWRNVSLRNDRRAYDFSRQVLSEVEPSSTIVNHWATASVFDYMRVVEGIRPDVDSFNVDFYFLGIQSKCEPVTNDQLLENGWIQLLERQSRSNSLCFIEPLHDLPDGYQWHQKGTCWELHSDMP